MQTLVSTLLGVLTAASAGASVCDDFYAPGFTLPEGTGAALPPPAGPKPAKGARYAAPLYGTCMVRATDHAAEPPAGFARTDYSRRQAFNADATRLLINANDGGWHLYDATTLAWIKELPGLGGDAEPQWHPTDPALLYYVPTNGGLVLYRLDVVTNAQTTVANFAGRLPWPGAAHVWTRSEGGPSADGRWWGFMVDDADFESLGLFTYDLVADAIVGTYATNGDRPDHVSVSASGRYLVASWDAPRGTHAFARDFSDGFQLLPTSEHSDLALAANGDDLFVSIDYGANDGDVFMTNLRTRVRTDLVPTYLAGTATAIHFSGKAFARPGWALVSTYEALIPNGGARQWLHDKLFVVELAANPRVYQLAHHNSTNVDYFAEPHATVSRDFTRIVFNSNWLAGAADTDDVDAYLIELPAGALPVGTLFDDGFE
jgi:hypothetical protein